jgi:hypothetical protein
VPAVPQRLLQTPTLLRGLVTCAIAALLVSAGCRELPNPETDEVTRVLRIFDRIQRPGGQDLPVEKYVGWSAQRDSGKHPGVDLTEQLQGLTDAQRGLIEQIKRIRTTSDAGLVVLDAYLAAHIAAHKGMEEVLAGRRLTQTAREKAGDASVQAAYASLRQARTQRRELEQRLGVVLDSK